MNYAELIQLYFDRSNALQWYWTLYVVIIGGLLAFSSLRQRRDALTGILVTVLFCFFAYKNLGAIQDVLAQRQAALEAISAYAGPGDIASVRRLLEPTLIYQTPESVRSFHMASDVLTIAAIWAMELRRMRAARAEPRP